MRLLDLFCGRWGWSRAFAARGWQCVGLDLVRPDELPSGCEFIKLDVMDICWRTSPVHHLNISQDKPNPFWEWCKPDFICASPPCEEFSVHAMAHFHPNPPYPELGIKLFNHTRAICELSGIPYVIENVKPAQWFVGQARARAGSFYLWGSGVPPLTPQGIVKGASQMRRDGRYKRRGGVDELMYAGKDERAAKLATIPNELSSVVAEYAERLLEQKKVSAGGEGDSVAP